MRRSGLVASAAALATLLAAALAALLASTPAFAAGTKERVDIVEQDLRDTQSHVAEQQERVTELEKEIAALRSALALDKPEQRVTPADLASRITSVETDLRVLYENQNETSRRLSVLSDKIDAVFRQLASAQVPLGPPTAPPPSGLSSPEAAGASVEEIAPRQGSTAGATSSPLGGPGATRPGGPGTGLPSAGVVTPGHPLVDPEELYQAARADFSRGSYDLAESGFQQFLDTFPDSDLADNSLYWIGECRDARGEPERAIEAYDGVIAKWPDGDKTPDAAYKKGLALLDLNRTAQGIVQLQRVKDRWPDAPAGRLARGKLQSLGLL